MAAPKFSPNRKPGGEAARAARCTPRANGTPTQQPQNGEARGVLRGALAAGWAPECPQIGGQRVYLG